MLHGGLTFRILLLESEGFWGFLIISKELVARRRGVMAEVYWPIRRKVGRPKATQPFDFAQGHESFDLAQDRELVERPVEWQMMP